MSFDYLRIRDTLLIGDSDSYYKRVKGKLIPMLIV